MTFIEKCIKKLATLDEVDDYVEEWHNNTEHHHESLREFLGMTPKEFGCWLRDGSSLQDIIREHEV